MRRGSFLVKCRLKTGLSQADIADKLGYSSQLVSLWEKNKATPDLSIISEYADILGVDLGGFINCEYKKKNDYCKSKRFNIDQFSANLKFLRKDKKLLQNDVAKKVHTNVKAVGSWENGSSTPSIDQFRKLCKIYNVSYDELLFAFKDENKIIVKNRHKKLIPILVPIVVVVSVAGAGTGLTINYVKNHKPAAPVHEHVFSVTEQAASYEKDGKKIFTCDTCGYSYEETIPHLDHHYASEYLYNESGHYHKCSDEGYESLTSELEDHIYSITTVNPTYTSDGSKTYECTVCDYSYVVNLPKLEHQYSDTYTSNRHYHYHQCIDEGYEDLFDVKEEHTFVSSTSGDITTYTCTVCGYSFDTSHEVEILDFYDEDHNMTFSVSNPEDLFIKVINPSKYDFYNCSYIIDNWIPGDGYHATGSGALLLYEMDEDFTVFKIKKESVIGDIFFQLPGSSFDIRFNVVGGHEVEQVRFTLHVVD